MSNRFFISKMRLISLLLLCSMTGFLHGAAVWTDGVTPDVIGQNVVFDGSASGGVITLSPTVGNCVSITTATLSPDVVVTMVGDTIIQGANGGGCTLILDAASTRTITFVMDHNLTFRGSPAGTPSDLLVIVRGAGEIIFQMDGGKTLTLTGNPTSGGRVQMYRQLININRANALTFKRNPSDPAPNSDVEVIVEQGSLLSYVSQSAQPTAPAGEHGIIIWNTTNTGTGRMILTIGQLGAVIVRARLINDVLCPTLSDIDPSTPAGYNAWFYVSNDNPSFSGSLLVQNYNNTLGELIWDPWCNLDVRSNPPFGNFNGVQWGFIVGSYGTLTVNGNAYLDYVSLTGTQCPVVPSLADASSRIKARNPSALFTDAQPDPSFIAPQITIGSAGQSAGIFFRSGVDNNGTIRSLSDPNPFTIDPAYRTPGAGFPVFDIEGPLNVTGYNTSIFRYRITLS
jgi:hypothetical protein